MTLLMLALLLSVSVASIVVLADSLVRLWQAFGGLKRAEQVSAVPVRREIAPLRVTTRVSYVRSMPAPQRVAA